MNIGEILSRTWKIIWKHKILWIFGILASCGQASGSSGGGASSSSAGSQSLMMPMVRMTDLGEMELAVILLIIAGGTLFVLFMLFVMLALNAVGRVGLVRGVVQAEAGKEKLSFGELLSGVKPFFWRVVGLNLLVGVAVLAALLVSSVAIIFIIVITLGIALLLVIPLLLLALPVMWAVTVVVEQANVALIVEDLSVLEALQRGWQVVKKNPGSYLGMGVVLILGVGLLGMLVIGLPILLVMTPFFAGMIVNEGIASQTGTILSLVCFVIFLPFMIALMGMLRSYIITAWTLTYLRLASPAPKAPEAAPEPKPAAQEPAEGLPDPLTGS